MSRAITHSIATMVSGSKTVTTAGTRVAFASSSTPMKKIDIIAKAANTGIVVIGDSTVVASAGTRKGIALNAGDVYSFELPDLANLYMDSTVDGEGVEYNYFK